MPKKGTTNNPNGREKGVPNKLTKLNKEALSALAEFNLPKVQQALELVYLESPKDYVDLNLKIYEYILPKLARVDANLSGDVKIEVLAGPITIDEENNATITVNANPIEDKGMED